MREPEPAFAEVAARYVQHKRSRQLRTSTLGRIDWVVETHLVPFFGTKRPGRITERDVVAYSDHQIAQRARIAHLRGQGKYLTGPKGGALRELSDVTINDTLALLTGLLAWAAKQGWGDRDANPAAEWRTDERPRLRAALEPDELAELIAAAATPRPARRQSPAVAARADLIVRLRDDERLSWGEIGKQVGVAETTAIYHYSQVKADPRVAGNETRAKADEAFVSVLARTGARVTEICDLNVGDVDLRHAKLRIADSKTGAGVREINMADGLVGIVTAYFKSRGPMHTDEAAFPDSDGKRRNKDQANKQTIGPALRLATDRRAGRGERALPVRQVGHRVSGTTMRIYAKVSAGRDRAFQNAAFDRLLDDRGDDLAA